MCNIATDIGGEVSARRLVEDITSDHRCLGVLVNNAGVEQIQDISQVNCVGRFLTVKHLMSVLLASTDGAEEIIKIMSFSLYFVAEGAVGFNVSALAMTRLTEDTVET